MSFKILLIVLFCFSLTVRSSEPSITHADPSLASEEDDSARCRLSGICEGRPTLEECQSRFDDHQLVSAAGSIPSHDFAARRDNLLACEFTSAGRAERVRAAARWTWKGYKDCAHGWDELRPLTCNGQEWHKLQLTPVDAMDTLALMNLQEEFNEALQLVREQLQPTEECNLFETTIRILGGLLSTHHYVASSLKKQHLSINNNEDVDNGTTKIDTFADTTKNQELIARDLLNAAVDLGSRLLLAFNSTSGIPYSDINLSTGSTSRSVLHSSMAETTTLSLEFTLLSRLTGEEAFEKAAMAVHHVLTPEVQKHDGLLPQFVSPGDGSCIGEYYMLGARSDSYYEYLLKQWILTGQTDTLMLQRYKHAIGAIRKKLLRRAGGLLYVGELEQGNTKSTKMDHLVCFLPGVLALGHFYNVSTQIVDTKSNNYYHEATDLELAEQLAETCYQMYRRTPTGLAPEIVFFSENSTGDSTGTSGSTSSDSSTTNSDSSASSNGSEVYPGAHASDIGGGDFMIKEDDAHNLLRPETVESLFILWKVTGNTKYREQAWLIFRAFERWTRVEGVQQCLAIDPEAAAGTATKEIARVASVEAAKAFAALKNTQPEQAVKQGINAAKAALESMRLHPTQQGVGDNREQVDVARLIENACLGAAEAAATATVEMLASSSGVDSLSELETSTTIPVSTSSSPASLCDFDLNLRGGGYSNLDSVKSIPPPRRDKMESFWIAETLKYLYLIFTEPPDRCLHPSCNEIEQVAVLPLTEFVFNTEAHPLPIVGPMENSRIKAVDEIDRKLLDPFAEVSDDLADLHTEEIGVEGEEEERVEDDGDSDGDGRLEEQHEVVVTSDDYAADVEEEESAVEHTEL